MKTRAHELEQGNIFSLYGKLYHVIEVTERRIVYWYLGWAIPKQRSLYSFGAKSMQLVNKIADGINQ